MSVESGLLARLKADAGVAALVGTRVYGGELPQNVAWPALSYSRVAGVSTMSHGGASGLARARFQIDCWAEGYEAARALAEAVRLALIGYRGALGDVTAQGIAVENIIDMPAVRAGATAIFHRVVDVTIPHSEAQPA